MDELLNKQRIESFIEVVMSVARGDYSVQLELTEENNELDALAMGVNMMVDELKSNRDIGLENEKIRLLNLQLSESQKKAEESDRLKSAFLANMSHEIRTPMNGIIGFTQLLKEPNLTGEKQQEYIRIIEKSCNRMLNIINDIIDISKIESGQMTVSVSDVSINKQMEEFHNFFKLEANKKEIELNLVMGLEDSQAIIKSDNEKFYAIFSNLIKNAIKFTRAGTIEFGYTLNSLATEVEFYVKDTGIGIPEDRRIAVFERFIQADIESKMAQQGAGLGLTISKAYVEMLGGKIRVESEYGKGTTFFFTLPFQNELNGIKILESEFPKHENEKQIDSLKILIVEDDETSYQLLSIVVQKFGKEITIVNSGIDAVEACRNNPDIDLILMDIRMSEMDGYEATHQIRQFNKDVIIIAQTAFGLSGDKERAIAAGCNDYIAKPVNKEELFSLIQKYFK